MTKKKKKIQAHGGWRPGAPQATPSLPSPGQGRGNTNKGSWSGIRIGRGQHGPVGPHLSSFLPFSWLSFFPFPHLFLPPLFLVLSISFLILPQAWGVTLSTFAEFGAPIARGSMYTFTHFHKGVNRFCPPHSGLPSPWELQPLSPHWAALTGIGLHQSQVHRMQHWWTFTALRKSFFATRTSLALVLTGVRGSFWSGTGQVLEAVNGITTTGMRSMSLGSMGSGLGPLFLLHNTSCLVSA